MERFAINILHKQMKDIYKICRLCGIDNPVKQPILEETIILGDEEEASLARKIEECVGIQVEKHDKMPQNICSLCLDKINDFYEYRLMCKATNMQTRSILKLPLSTNKKKLENLQPPKAEVKEEEDKSLLTRLTESALQKKKKNLPKHLVRNVSKSFSKSTDKGVKGFRGRKRDGDLPALKLEVEPLLAVKAPNKRERQRQMAEQSALRPIRGKKRDAEVIVSDKIEPTATTPTTRAKRSSAVSNEVAVATTSILPEVITPPPPKKIKFEYPCQLCTEEFKTQVQLESHLGGKHVALVKKFGCGSCREDFNNIVEYKDHNLWHQLTNTLYACFKCKKKFDKNLALVKHVSLNACGRVSRARQPTLLPDITCNQCHKVFITQNLYEWHGCFIKQRSNCPKCGKFFAKKTILMRHYVVFCTAELSAEKQEPLDPPKEEIEIPFPPQLDQIPETSTNGRGSRSKKSVRFESENSVKDEPSQSILENENITSLLASGEKLKDDADIATITNLLSSVNAAIATLSASKAKKKKKKKDREREREKGREKDRDKDRGKDRERDREKDKSKEKNETATSANEPPIKELPTKDDVPMVVVSKEHVKQECLEIEAEPAQIQEPIPNEEEHDESQGDVHDGDYENDNYDYGFQDDADEDVESDDAGEDDHRMETCDNESIKIKKEVSDAEFDESLARHIKKEPGLPDDDLITAPRLVHRRKRARNQKSSGGIEALSSPSSSSAIVASIPPPSSPSALKPTLILKIKKEKGQLNASVVDDENSLDSLSSPVAETHSDIPETLPARTTKENNLIEPNKIFKKSVGRPPGKKPQNKSSQPRKPRVVYKKPAFLALKIKQEKFDAGYERQEKIASEVANVVIKQERLDPTDNEVQTKLPDVESEVPGVENSPVIPDIIQHVPHPKANRRPNPMRKILNKQKPYERPIEKHIAEIIAFDGVRIKQEKDDRIEMNDERPASTEKVVGEVENKLVAVTSNKHDKSEQQPVKKSKKLKINPFSLFHLKMQMPVISNVVSNAASNVQIPVISNVASISAKEINAFNKDTLPQPVAPEKSNENDNLDNRITEATEATKETVSAAFIPIPIKNEVADDDEMDEHEESQHYEDMNNIEENASKEGEGPVVGHIEEKNCEIQMQEVKDAECEAIERLVEEEVKADESREESTSPVSEDTNENPVLPEVATWEQSPTLQREEDRIQENNFVAEKMCIEETITENDEESREAEEERIIENNVAETDVTGEEEVNSVAEATTTTIEEAPTVNETSPEEYPEVYPSLSDDIADAMTSQSLVASYCSSESSSEATNAVNTAATTMNESHEIVDIGISFIHAMTSPLDEPINESFDVASPIPTSSSSSSLTQIDSVLTESLSDTIKSTTDSLLEVSVFDKQPMDTTSNIDDLDNLLNDKLAELITITSAATTQNNPQTQKVTNSTNDIDLDLDLECELLQESVMKESIETETTNNILDLDLENELLLDDSNKC